MNTIQTIAKPNRHAGACAHCGGYIAPQAGLLARNGDRWAVVHNGPCPELVTATPPVQRVTEDGIYVTEDGTIYKVQIAKQGSGRLYAKRLEVTVCTDPACGHPTVIDEHGDHRHGHFVYAPGVIHTLRADQKMAEHDARAFGRLYGICCVCGADLTDEKSIAAGIGPICGGRI